MQDNEMQSFKVEQSLHGRLIGAKGKRMLTYADVCCTAD
jgi:hypothetical protein